MAKWLSVLIILIVFGGCATKVDLSEYKDINTKKQIQVKAKQFDISNDSIKLIGNYNAFDDYTLSAFSSMLSQSRVFSFVNGQSDIDIRIYIDELGSQSRFFESRWVNTGVIKREIVDKRGVKRVIEEPTGYYSKPYWEYNIYSQITIKVTNLNNNAQNTYTRNSDYIYTQNGHFHSRDIAPEYVFDNAIDKTINKLIIDIQNDYSALGTIISAKESIDDSDKKIFMINLGTSYGIHQENRVKIYTKDGGVEYAKVSNQITPETAWIVPQSDNTRIDIGDNAIIEYR